MVRECKRVIRSESAAVGNALTSHQRKPLGRWHKRILVPRETVT
jgi:hypothetical protein